VYASRETELMLNIPCAQGAQLADTFFPIISFVTFCLLLGNTKWPAGQRPGLDGGGLLTFPGQMIPARNEKSLSVAG